MKSKDWKIDPLSLFSHELKTPLSSLRLGLALLEKDFEKNKNILYLMKEEVEDMIAFITDNLDLRYIQEKKDLFQFEWKSFEQILSQVCSSLQNIIQEEKLSFDIKKAKGEENFELLIDSSWISQVLKNLLSNAIKFSPKNKRIFIEYGLNDKEAFFCSVRDEGIGLADPKKVFDPFYKTPTQKNKKAFKNTGLGLTISKAILSAHGGSISAFPNTKHQGSTFCFVLPKIRLLKKSA